MLDLNQKDYDAIRTGTWELPCLSMELSRNDGTKVFQGSGIVRQDENHLLTFKLIDAHHAGGWSNYFRDINERDIKAGQLIPISHFYILRVSDLHAREWVSSPTLDFNQTHGPSTGAVVTGWIRELHLRHDVPDSTSGHDSAIAHAPKTRFKNLHLTYRIFADIGRFPCNSGVEEKMVIAGKERSRSSSLCVAVAECGEYAFELIQHEGCVEFNVASKEPCSEYPHN